MRSASCFLPVTRPSNPLAVQSGATFSFSSSARDTTAPSGSIETFSTSVWITTGAALAAAAALGACAGTAPGAAAVDAAAAGGGTAGTAPGTAGAAGGTAAFAASAGAAAGGGVGVVPNIDGLPV